LERYEHLAYEKEDNELTTLQLLAKMPSTFKSQTQMGPLKNFMDVVHHVEDYGQRCKFIIHFFKEKVFLLFGHYFFLHVFLVCFVNVQNGKRLINFGGKRKCII